MTVALSLRPLGKALGTEIVGVDVSQTLGAATFEWIDRTFAEHPVLVFRNQHLGPAALAAFGARFGHPQPHILEQYRHPEHPQVSYITNVDKAGGVDRFGVTRASSWHTDETYEDALPRLAILHALEVPSARPSTRCPRRCSGASSGWSAFTAAPTDPTASSCTGKTTFGPVQKRAPNGGTPPSRNTP